MSIYGPCAIRQKLRVMNLDWDHPRLPESEAESAPVQVIIDQLAPNTAGAHRQRAEALWDKGEANEAIAELREAIRLEPKNTAHSVRLEKILGDYKQATLILKGTLTSEDPLDTFDLTQNSFYKVHLVPFERGKTYSIGLEGTFDTFLRIENAAKTPLLFNDDVSPRNNLNSRLIFTPSKKDTYRLVVTSYEPKETGSYTLSIREAAKAGAATIIKGRLEKMDPAPKEGNLTKTHKIELAGGWPYTLELTSSDFAASFVLFDASGKEDLAKAAAVAGRPARLDLTPEATSVFQVTVTSGQRGRTGAYTLTIQRYEETKKAKTP